MDTVRIPQVNPTTVEKPVFGFKANKQYYLEVPRASIVFLRDIAPAAGYVLVNVARTDTYATTGYSKDSYVRLNHERAVQEWTAAGYSVIERKRVDYRNWIGHDWYGRPFYDYAYQNEVWARANGPVSILSGETRYNVETLISDNWLKALKERV